MQPDLARKLQIKPGGRFLVLNAPADLAALLGDDGAGPVTGGIAFCHDPQDVARLAPDLISHVTPDGLIWFAYRKGSAGQLVGLTRDAGWDAVHALGYDTVRSIAIDAIWTGLRFRA